MAEDEVHTEMPKEAETKVNEDNSANINAPTQVRELNNLFKEMRVESLYRTDMGPSATIDVIPDFRYITLQLVEHCIKIYQQIAQLSVPTITPPSLMAYFLECIYVYGAVSDIWHIRETTSYYGNEFLKIPQAEQSLILSCHHTIPPFIRDIIRQLEFTFDPRRQNLAYIYSFAAFFFNIDCGRVYPIHMFIKLHNLIAEAGPTDTEETIWTKWLQYVVIEDANTHITVGHLIGGAYANHIVENFMTKSLRKLLSPLAPQGNMARPVLEPFEFDIPVQTSLELVNPYIYLLGNENTMFATFMNYRNLLRSHINELFPGCQPLWQLYGLESGSTIMNHSYTIPTVPTFHAMPIELTTRSTSNTINNFKERLKFKCTWQCKEADFVTYKSPLIGTHVPALYQVNTLSHVDSDKLLSQALDPDEEPWIIYSPYSPGKAATYYPLTSGLIIETFEIDGTHIPMPALANSIHDENSHFLESCIPIKAAIGRSSYNGEIPHLIRARSVEKKHETKICFSKFDMTVHQIPEYVNRVYNHADMLPGFTAHNGLRYPAKGTNKIAYDGNTKDAKSLPSSEFPYHLYTWSSYRWMSKKHSSTAQFAEYTYFITNFRTIYGTFPQTMKSESLPRLIEED